MSLTKVEPPAPRRATQPRAGITSLIGSGAALAVLVAVGLTAYSGAQLTPSLGLPDPGTLTTMVLLAMRVLAEVAMVITIGGLLLAAFLVPPQHNGYVDVAGYRALRMASWASAAWATAGTLMVPFSIADAVGRPVADVLDARLLVALTPQLSDATAWALTALVALVVLLGCRIVLSWGWTVAVLGLAVLGPLPVAVTGHSGTGGGHDIATDSLVLHVLAASLWVGGLVAVLALAAGRGPERINALATAVPRFSRTALGCWLVLAVTGVVNALVRVPAADVFDSTYGALVLAKVAALGMLGIIGFAHRMRTVRPASGGDARALIRLAGVEVLLMLATIGLAVALGRTSPPEVASEPQPSRIEAMIGYDLPGPPTLLRLSVDWRFDLIVGSAAVAAGLCYLLAVRRIRRRDDRWPVHRTVAWIGGCIAVLVASSSGIGRYGAAMFSVHMAEQVILSVLGPILLVSGAPITLALRALPSASPTDPPGAREWLLAAIHSPLARMLTHPLVSLPVFVGSYYALYLSGLFALAVPEHWAHVLMNLYFVIIGALFFWPLIGSDPVPRRLSPTARLGVLFASIVCHTLFGLVLMSSSTIIGSEFYWNLALPWVPNPLRDQQFGGLAWLAGEIPLLIVLIVLLVRWARLAEGLRMTEIYPASTTQPSERGDSPGAINRS